MTEKESEILQRLESKTDKLIYGLYGDGTHTGHQGDIPEVIALARRTNGIVMLHSGQIAVLQSQISDRTSSPVEKVREGKLDKTKKVSAYGGFAFLIVQAIGSIAGWW